MKKAEPAGYFIDPARPAHPIHARLSYAARHRLVAITEQEANALSEALRAAAAQEARGVPSAPPAPLSPPAPEPPASEALREPERPSEPSVPEVVPILARWALPPVAVQPMFRADFSPGALDIDRRAVARARVNAAVTKAGEGMLAEQIRYEVAMQAHNDKVDAVAMFDTEARVLGITAKQLIDRVIEDRRTRERRMMRNYAILARVSAGIAGAKGVDIDMIADTGIAEIEQEE